MKISVNKFLISIFLFLVCQCFAIFRTGTFIYKADLINMSVIVFSIIIIILYKFKPLTDSISKSFRKIFIFSIIIWLVLCAYSYTQYNSFGQSLKDTIACSLSNLVIIMLFPLSYLLKKTNIDTLKNLIKNIGAFVSVLAILQVFLYNYEIVFLDLEGVGLRNNSLRFGLAGYFVSISLIICYFDYLKNRKIKDLAYFILMVIFVIYAQKTRTEIVYLIVTLYFTSLLFLKSKNKKIFFLIVGIIASVCLVYGNFLQDFILQLSNDSGVGIRFSTIEYYFNQFKESPIFGMGFIKTNTTNQTLYGLLHGTGIYSGYFYRDDVGIIGLINEKGLLGLIWYIWISIILIKQAIKLYKKNHSYIWMIAVCIYLLLCSINIIYVNSLRISMLMIILCLFNNYYEYEKRRIA